MKTLLLCSMIVLSVHVNAQPPKGPVTPGTTYGSDISPEGAIPAADLPKLLQNSQSRDVKIIGTVAEVCPKMGCWLSLDMPGDSKVFVKMKDYGFFVPVELTGKRIVIDAQAMVVKTSIAELRHYAEDAKKSREEVEAITEDKEEIRLTANGIVVVQ